MEMIKFAVQINTDMANHGHQPHNPSASELACIKIKEVYTCDCTIDLEGYDEGIDYHIHITDPVTRKSFYNDQHAEEGGGLKVPIPKAYEQIDPDRVCLMTIEYTTEEGENEVKNTDYVKFVLVPTPEAITPNCD